MNNINTSYLRKISDDFGLWQHVIDGQISLKDGYSLDDNLRGLMIAHKLGDAELVATYFNYIERSFNDKTKMFIEFFDENLKPINEDHINPSHDTQGMARFILAYCIRNNIETDKAKALLEQTKPYDFKSEPHLRPIAYEILMSVEDESQQEYGMQLVNIFRNKYNTDTKWFESRLTYANALILYAVARFYNHYKLDDAELLAMLEDSMDMLDLESRVGVIPAPPGNREWFTFGDNKKDVYGQQPIDAAYMVLANIELYQITESEMYMAKVKDWFEWFEGNNIFKQSLIKDSSCADGIDIGGLSKNFGAESTLMYLWAAIEFNNITK